MKNRDVFIKAIENDCQTRFVYRDKGGQTCAIAALADAAGLSHLVPDCESVYHNVAIDHPHNVILLTELCAFYGLRADNLADVQAANDQHSTPEERRRAILTYYLCPSN